MSEKRKMFVHFRIVVEVEEKTADDAFETALDLLREYGGGDLIGHSIIDANGNAIEDKP